jgi:class 3 adenylate cyclase/tetratricopeptide (TPR) repeat protein
MTLFAKLVNTYTMQEMAIGRVQDEVSGATLAPYVPRLVIEWARDMPAARWREVDGTLAFVDISGFTAMSEKLSSLGKAGAEEVTSVMNATFARLLEVAYAFGGGLIKFGGDALLLFFDGHEHQTRAAAAVFGLRAALEETGRPETSAGTVELRMHVGLHSGTFRFFLVGDADAHRELIVAGPAASHTVTMEGTAEAGEILISTAAAAALPPHTLGEPKGEGILLAAPPEAETKLEPLPDVALLELERFVPGEVRAQVTASVAEAEHRAATVAFLHVGGLDELDTQAAGEALDELVRKVQSAAGEHGVCFLETDIDKGGTKIVLTAGAPIASENDEERMLRAVRAIVESELPLPLRVGVGRGRVFAGEVGAAFRRTYTILGDTAALAARLMSRAEPGQVLVAAQVIERSRTEFETTALEPFHVKGKSEPVHAVDLGTVKGTREAGRSRLPLVNRVREMAVLDAALTPVRMGFGTLVELVGEPGIGKSRIVEELVDRAAELRQVATACEQYEATTPYHPFRELLRGLLGVELDGSAEENSERLRRRLEEIDPELVPWIPLLARTLDADVLPTPEADELDPAFRRARLNGAVGSLLGRLVEDPSLLLFEDVHWMDEASSDLLRHIASQISTRPWFACATRRPVPGGFVAAEGVPPVPALTLRLEPLSADDARELLGSAAGDLPEDELEAITARAGGNPLFLRELAGARAEPEQLPESVEAMVAAKIDLLDPPDRALLRWASVLGTAFTGELILEVLREDPTAAADSEAWDRVGEFVERDPNVPGGFRFRHALIRDTAYEGLAFQRRRELHASAGEAYERLHAGRLEDVSELLSLHFSRGERPEKAWAYSISAAKRAEQKFANVDAAEFYRRALAVAQQLPELEPEQIKVAYESLGDLLALSGAYADAAEAYESARQLARPATPGHVQLFHKEARLRENMGRYAEALEWLERGLAAVEELEEEDRVSQRIELMLDQAGILFRQGNLAGAVDWGTRAVSEANEVSDLQALAHGYYLLHLAYSSLGSPERRAFRGLALPIYEELGDLLGQANVLNNLGIDAYYEGRWDEALDLYERSRKLRERIGDVVGAATIKGNIGEILSDQGRFEEARAIFEEVKEVVTAAGARLLEYVAESNLGRLAAREGRFDDAESALSGALAGFEELEAASFALETRARLAELDVLRGDRAASVLERADVTIGKGAAPAVEAMLQRVRGYALRQSGQPDRARAAFEESLLVARTADAEYEAGLTLAALGRADEAGEILARLGVIAVPRVPE